MQFFSASILDGDKQEGQSTLTQTVIILNIFTRTLSVSRFKSLKFPVPNYTGRTYSRGETTRDLFDQ